MQINLATSTAILLSLQLWDVCREEKHHRGSALKVLMETEKVRKVIQVPAHTDTYTMHRFSRSVLKILEFAQVIMLSEREQKL